MKYVVFQTVYLRIYNGRDRIPAKIGLPRGRNLPFTLESRKGNYQRSRNLRGGFTRSNSDSTIPM